MQKAHHRIIYIINCLLPVALFFLTQRVGRHLHVLILFFPFPIWSKSSISHNAFQMQWNIFVFQTVIIYVCRCGYLFNSCLCMKPVAMSLPNSDLYLFVYGRRERFSYSPSQRRRRTRRFYLHLYKLRIFKHHNFNSVFSSHENSWVHRTAPIHINTINQHKWMQGENSFSQKQNEQHVIDQHFALINVFLYFVKCSLLIFLSMESMGW